MLPYRTAPDRAFEFVPPTGEFAHGVEHNSLGWRDVEHAVAKPPGTFRILGLGDSFTYGVGAEFDQTFLARLEARLGESRSQRGGPAVEVLKAGMPRFFPYTERLMLEHYGLAFDPDLVIVAVLPNDLTDTYIGPDAVSVDESGYLKSHGMSGLGALGPLLYVNSHAARSVLSRIAKARESRHQPPDATAFFRDGGPHEDVWRELEAELARIVELSDTAGARTLVALIPHSRHYSRRLTAEEVDYPARRLAAFLSAEGAGGRTAGGAGPPLFLDLRAALWGAEPDGDLENYWPVDGHCTPVGYDVIARELAAVVGPLLTD